MQKYNRGSNRRKNFNELPFFIGEFPFFLAAGRKCLPESGRIRAICLYDRPYTYDKGR